MNEVSDRGHVVVTGTSTGIGAAAALHLAEQGFEVFAGVRRDADGEALRERASGELTPVTLDITDGAQIAAAVERVTAAVGARGLAGLVNVAGIVKPAPLEFQPLADFREQLEVNLIGHLAVIQSFLPLIRQGSGRIVNVGSIGGLVVLPVHGAYSASKFGMEAISDALRLELRQWRIPVSLVDPGATESAIFGKTLAAIDDVFAVCAFFFRRRTLERKRWLLWIGVFTIPLPYLAALAGWVLTEVGRQPWIVFGLLETTDANSPSVTSTTIWVSLIVFGLLYLILTLVNFALLRRYSRVDPPEVGGEGDEFAVPVAGY